MKTNHGKNWEGLDFGQNFKNLDAYIKFYFYYHKISQILTCKHAHTSPHSPWPSFCFSHLA